ncbi:TonB-dependent receptor domain-containing protein [Sphingomonas corticis]|uniref:TonB-dependent receptor n=1 Tax=Sphingomonas corticis TaxID=2722791 RepID=A0ABX1CW15_9SPHN|nr:TonB-dependent receptor [Sphingomonas corticis]
MAASLSWAPVSAAQEATTAPTPATSSDAAAQADPSASLAQDTPREQPSTESGVAPDVPPQEQNSGSDIVVTALRRNERLQEAPASISVVTGDIARTAGVVSLADVSKIVPSLRFEGGIRPGVPSIALRGISAVQNGEAPVSIIVDGVQIPFLSLARMDLLDISSVEILKGPQGALYGRGAIAGAIIINTRQPDDDVRFSGRVVAQEGDDYQGIATISGPLAGDVLFAKLTGSYQNRKGLLRNVTTGRTDDFIDQGSVDGELLFEPTDGTRVQVTGMYTRGRVGTNNLTRVPLDRLDDFSIELEQNFRNYDQRRLWRAAVKLDQDTPIGTLTVVAQHARARDFVVTDIDYTSAALQYNFNPLLDVATNVDARITSENAGPLNWIFGGFYQYRESEIDINVMPDPAATTPQASRFTDQFQTSKAFGVYGHATLELGGGVTAIGALRYDRDKRFDELRETPGSAISAPFDAWQPSATFRWQAAPDLLLYATYGQGFRSGGFNPANTVIPSIGAARTYEKEISRNYEMGFKSQFADRRVTLNASFYRTDYDNTQFQRTILSPVTARFITSIAKSRVNGVEVDLTVRPTTELTVGASYSLSDTRIEDFDGTSLYVGNPLPNAFHDNEQVNVQYEPRFDDTYRGLFRVDVTRRGRISYDLANSVTFGSAAFLNARVGLQTDRWSLAVFGANLTDRRVPEFVFPYLFGQQQGRLANQPFRAGVELNVNLGG